MLGPCATSVYLEDCQDCVFFISSHQMRIHECFNCQLYVRINSHPIFEDCTGLGFAPYCLHYDDIEHDFEVLTYPLLHYHRHLHHEHVCHVQAADLKAASCWDNPIDFRWHRATQSPNWFIIPESAHVQMLPMEDGWRLLRSTSLLDTSSSSAVSSSSSSSAVAASSSSSSSSSTEGSNAKQRAHGDALPPAPSKASSAVEAVSAPVAIADDEDEI